MISMENRNNQAKWLKHHYLNPDITLETQLK